MRLPRWLKKLLFGEKLSADEIVQIIARGGLRAADTRVDVKPPIMFFGVFDGESVVIRAFHRQDVDSEVIHEFSTHLATCAADYLETVGQDEE